MASHFSSLGIKITSKEDFIEHYNRAYNEGERIATAMGHYYLLKMGEGVELWGQMDRLNTALGMNPAFNGNGRIKVRVERAIHRDSDTALDGALYGWADPDDNAESGAYPMVFDVPNFCVIEDMQMPQTVDVQVTALAHELSVYSNEADFDASQTGELKFAAESFIPSGLFGDEGTSDFEAQAMFTGTVLETAVLTNGMSGLEFVWAKVKTLGGEYDVVADPSLVTDEIVVGGIIQGSFWLTGRIVGGYKRGEREEKKFSFKSLFGKKRNGRR